MPSQHSKRNPTRSHPTEKTYYWQIQLIGKDVSNRQSFNAWNRFYDIVTMTITVFDLLTDLILLSEFYYASNGMIFFWFCLSFVLLTHICYVVLALVTFGLTLNHMQQIIWFCLLIPISPVLPYMIYCASWPDSWITINIIDKFGLERLDWNGNNLYPSYRSTPWKRFVSEKLVTNIAFIMQSVCESLPLSIIQIIAIICFQQYRNPILLSSISFSLLSIVWKSILMASGTSISSSVYKWLCFVTDFYATLFVMISWAFLSTNNQGDFVGLLNMPGISWLGYIYMYKVIFLVSPLVISIVMLLIFELSIDSIHEFLCWHSRSYVLLIVCYVPFVIIVMITVIILALITSLIAAEFALFSWSAWFVEIFFNQRYKWLEEPVFWNIIVNNFLFSNTRGDRDLVWRLCIVNYILSQTTESEWVKRMFVDFNSWMSVNEYEVFDDAQYPVSLEMIRNQFRDSNSRSAPTMFGSIIRNYTEHIRNLSCCNFEEFFVNISYFLILFIGIPLYILSRITTLLYPFWCVGYMLFANEFNRIPVFCVITTLIYCVLILVLLIIGRKLYDLMNVLWHIMPGRQKLVKSLIVEKPDLILMQLNAMYYFHINRPIIHDILGRKFSNDVGKIIAMYLPRTYYEECRLHKNGGNKRRRRISNFSTYSSYSVYSNFTPSSSPHLAIDCVDPLPPMPRYCGRYKNEFDNEAEEEFGHAGIHMTVPTFAIPIDCEDPLSLLKGQSIL
eukprot:593433_1